MNWKEIVRKLTSRKLWTAVGSFASLLIVARGGTESQAAQVAAIIMGGATVIAYIIGEGLVDQAAANGTIKIEDGRDGGQEG